MTNQTTELNDLVLDATPAYFGDSENAVFGWFHPAAGPQAKGAVVICGPTGYEGVQSYRAIRLLAEKLAAAGHPTLRFDYHGTGDSPGDDFDSDRVGAWKKSVTSAVDFARAASGIDHLTLVGIRLGGTLATVTAAQQSIDQLIIWEPCLSGAIYVREMHILAAASLKSLLEVGSSAPPNSNPDILEAAGFSTTRETVDGLDQLKLKEITWGNRPRILFIARDDRPESKKFPEHLIAGGLNVDYQRLPGLAQMLVPPLKSIVPTQVFDAIETWLATGTEPAKRPPVSPGQTSLTFDVGAARITERPLRFGPDDRLFAIQSVPDDSAPKRPTVLLVAGGAVTRTSANRLYVTVARQLAALGHPVYRMDVPGLGDSRPAPGEADKDPYPPSLHDAVEALIDHVRSKDHDIRFLLAGLCSGAYAAFGTALRDTSVDGIFLINPLILYWKPGMNTQAPAAQHFLAAAEFKQSFLKPAHWINPRRLAKLTRSLLQALRQKIRSLRDNPAANQLPADLTRLRDKGVQVTFAFSKGDPGHPAVTRQAGSVFEQLKESGDLEVHVFEGADHTFSPQDARRRLIETLTRWCQTPR